MEALSRKSHDKSCDNEIETLTQELRLRDDYIHELKLELALRERQLRLLRSNIAAGNKFYIKRKNYVLILRGYRNRLFPQNSPQRAFYNSYLAPLKDLILSSRGIKRLLGGR